MRMISIKEFGGEVKFTKFIADNDIISSRLLEATDNGMSNYTVMPEEYTKTGKRIDLVIRDEQQNIVQLVECQDASGWLDENHACKILGYSHSKKCDDVILLTEDLTEEIRELIIRMNNETWLNIYLVSPTIIKTENEVDVFFKTILRPADWSKKTVRTNNTSSNYRNQFVDFIQDKMEEYGDLFTHCTKSYLDIKNVGGLGVNLGIIPQVQGARVNLYHAGKYTDNETYQNSLESVGDFKKDGRSNYFTVDNFDKGVEEIRKIKKAFEEGVVKV